MSGLDWSEVFKSSDSGVTVTCYRWLPGDDLRTRPAPLWADFVRDHVGGDW